jgi:hypothetical protein
LERWRRLIAPTVIASTGIRVVEGRASRRADQQRDQAVEESWTVLIDVALQPLLSIETRSHPVNKLTSNICSLAINLKADLSLFL